MPIPDLQTIDCEVDVSGSSVQPPSNADIVHIGIGIVESTTRHILLDESFIYKTCIGSWEANVGADAHTLVAITWRNSNSYNLGHRIIESKDAKEGCGQWATPKVIQMLPNQARRNNLVVKKKVRAD